MLTQKRAFQHIFFWLASFIFLTWFYTQLSREYTSTLVLVAIIGTVSITSVYFINLFLIPRFLISRKYWKFGLFTLYSLIIAVWLSLLAIYLYFFYLLTRTDGSGFPFKIDIAFIIAGMFLVVFAGVLGKVIRENFRIIKEKSELERNQLEIKAKLKEIELQSLKSQFQPHFLFNTLNNLYSLALKKSDETPGMILKLSKLLDYSLYGAENEKVKLSEEIEFLENYLEIAKMRFGNSLDIRFTKKIEKPDFMISPLLLITFLENATKHGISPGKTSQIDIQLVQERKRIFYEVENRKNLLEKEIKANNSKAGIGLSQLKSRLKILYPQKHKIEIIDEGDTFKAILKINEE